MTGGGSSTEALIGTALGVIEAGLCHTVAIYRAMNGYSEARQGGSPAASRPATATVTGAALTTTPYGVASPAQNFQFAASGQTTPAGASSARAIPTG